MHSIIKCAKTTEPEDFISRVYIYEKMAALRRYLQ